MPASTTMAESTTTNLCTSSTLAAMSCKKRSNIWERSTWALSIDSLNLKAWWSNRLKRLRFSRLFRTIRRKRGLLSSMDWLPIRMGSQLLELQLNHHHSPSLEAKSNGWTMRRISLTGRTSTWKRPIQGFLTIPLSRLNLMLLPTCMDWLLMRKESQLKEPQPSHPLSPSWEEKSNGWITPRT